MKLFAWCALLFISTVFAESSPSVPMTEAQRHYENALTLPEIESVAALTLSANAGYAPAMHALGWAYRNGRGVAADAVTAFGWFKHAAEAGLPDAQHMLSLLYAQGEGTAPDNAAALTWLEQAARNGHPAAQNMFTLMGGK